MKQASISWYKTLVAIRMTISCAVADVHREGSCVDIRVKYCVPRQQYDGRWIGAVCRS